MGYLCVSLRTPDRNVKVKVHRLVAEAFLGLDPVRTTVNHRDGIKTNNALSNLEWMTLAENIAHGFATGLYSNARRNRALNPRLGMSRKVEIA